MTREAAILYFKELIAHMTNIDAMNYFNSHATDRIMVGNCMLKGLDKTPSDGYGNVPSEIIIPVKPQLKFSSGEIFDLTKDEAFGFIDSFNEEYEKHYNKIYLKYAQKTVGVNKVHLSLFWLFAFITILFIVAFFGCGALILNR